MSDEVKTAIMSYVKEHGMIPTSFGAITVDGSLLGQGGNGLVYPIAFEGPAAIKILTEPATDAPSTKMKRFQREYRRLVRIPPHSNLIRLFHYEVITLEEMRVPAIIMERCAATLKTYVQTRGAPPVEELRKLCGAMCSAIGHIHTHGIIHRDIKPENVLIREDGSFVLADFGIASFDPELFPGTDLTKKGDRMANLQFSAPEQFEKDAEPTTAADIFALGQVLYWSVTQKTFRGASPPSMASVDQRYSPFDVLVPMMSRQEPLARLQTAQAVVDQLNKNDEVRRRDSWHSHVINSLRVFEEALRKCTPGERGIIHLSSKEDIDRLLHTLGEICEPNELWWTQGHAKLAVKQITKIDDEHWLLGGTEYKFTDCWVTRDSGLDRCSVLMRSEAMPPFGLYEDSGFEDEVAGFLDGQYFDYHAHDDGYARINGVIVEVSGRSTIRHRYLRQNYFVMATKYNSVLVSQADRVIDPVIKSYNAGQEVDIKNLQEWRKLPKHEVSRMYD